MDAPTQPPSVFDRFDLPAASALLGWTLLAINREAQTVEVGFELDDRFVNPGGTIQGGFVAAMLDDTQGPALFGTSEGKIYAPTIDFHITFIRPARPGKFVGKGRVVNLGKTIVITEADLYDEAGELLAKGSFTNRRMERE
jgi:uncharacterized protein (TIGR00369 family)